MNWFPNLANSLPTYVWLTVSAGFFAVGEYFSKKFVVHPEWMGLLSVCSMYLLGSLAWLPALFRTNQLAATGTAWLLLSMLATLGVGFGIYHEKITLIHAGGIVLAAIALVLLNYQN